MDLWDSLPSVPRNANQTQNISQLDTGGNKKKNTRIRLFLLYI